MLSWFRRNIRKVEVFGVGVEFHPPTEPTSALPSADTPTATTLSSTGAANDTIIVRKKAKKMDRHRLLAALQQRVLAGKITTYGECSQWAFGHRKGANAVVAMLEAAAQEGNQQWTNRVVSSEGELLTAAQRSKLSPV